MSTLTEYNPNSLFVIETIKITIMVWDYKKEMYLSIKGAARGVNMLAVAIDYAYEDMTNENELIDLVLVNPNGEELDCSGWDELDFKKNIVSLEIIKSEGYDAL